MASWRSAISAGISLGAGLTMSNNEKGGSAKQEEDNVEGFTSGYA